MGYIDPAQLERLAAPLAKSGYGEYLLALLGDSQVGPQFAPPASEGR